MLAAKRLRSDGVRLIAAASTSPRRLGQRVQQGVEAARLDGAGPAQLLADGARELDGEAGQPAIGPCEMQRRVVVVGQEADDARRAGLGLVEPDARIPEVRARRRPTAPSAGCREQQAEAEAQQAME